jgi:hypothetical protein
MEQQLALLPSLPRSCATNFADFHFVDDNWILFAKLLVATPLVLKIKGGRWLFPQL